MITVEQWNLLLIDRQGRLEQYLKDFRRLDRHHMRSFSAGGKKKEGKTA
jgi:hypothetical protein